MQQLKQFILKEHNLVFLFSVAIIVGPALSILFGNDLSQFPDCESYTGLAHFDFNQSSVRRYRVIIPFVAAFLDFIAGSFFSKLSPTYFIGNFSMPFCFFLINTTLMGYFGTLIYKYCRAHQVSRLASIVGLLVMLSARYTSYFAALPLVDSLFCVIVGMSLLGTKTKNTSILMVCIFIGPFVKESFIFIAPIIFFFSHIKKTQLALYFLLSGIFVFSFHGLIDYYFPPPHIGWLKADMGHLNNILYYLPLLLSFYGIYKILINLGFWLLPLLAPLFSKTLRKLIAQNIDNYVLYFLLSVLLQMLLSGSMERMFYLAMPLISLLVAIIFDDMKKHIRFENFRSKS
jgi:hypothetical protein